jgi:gluconokinase
MIVIVAGVSGSGKSTVGELLARSLGWPFTDGDSLHPAANVAKMRAGVPLTDEDRQPWLEAVAALLDRRLAAGEPGVVTCSALRRSYRDLLLDGRPAVRIVFLDAPPDLLASRLTTRHGHFFSADLLDSQLAILENPQPAERIVVVAAVGTAEQTALDIAGRLGLEPGSIDCHPARTVEPAADRRQAHEAET